MKGAHHWGVDSMVQLDPWPILESGDEGLNVYTIQFLLRCAVSGQWKNLEGDGDFRGKTKEAVEEFQRSVHIRDDGQVGQVTWGKMIEGQAITCFPKTNDRGDCVKAGQCQLLKNGELKSFDDVDGEFGPVTDDALSSFQRRMGLPVNHQIDRTTWEHLIRCDNPG
jgi:peptidoglycan hydrolase-like protein with peptidoglycan-binding domain